MDLQRVVELVEEGDPFDDDVVTGLENADNDEKTRTAHT